MKTSALLIIVLLLSGCGARVLAPASVDRIKQDLADMSAANSPVVAPSIYVREANNKLVGDMAKIIEIDPQDLVDFVRVPSAVWQANPEGALNKTQENVQKPVSIGEGWLLAGGAAATTIGIMLINILSKSGGPLGVGIDVIKHVLLADKNPKEFKIANKLQDALENYKLKDPKWRDNPIFQEISDILTTSEKDYIKDKINA
jgi:hypothetical protein